MFNTLSGRFFILTVVFVMLAEVLIFVPSVARFRQDYLNARLERAQIASLALEAEHMISTELEAELLATAEVYNVVLPHLIAPQHHVIHFRIAQQLCLKFWRDHVVGF